MPTSVDLRPLHADPDRGQLSAFMADVKAGAFGKDSTKLRGLEKDWPISISRDQILSLEGDFDRHFTLYCPREYERDALYLFTPDLMALLIDNVAVYDAEIVDDWLFFYSSKPFSPRDEAQWRRMLGIVDVVGAKAFSRAERYTDSRTSETGPRPNVAPAGKRLSARGRLLPTVIIVGGTVLIGILIGFL
ncbi:hypothetical protein [Microbacterium sp. MPKO10]|uniref:hypothetical protein n=1 Tax=Microbacterium sp. MPKO10 TaxID=2989818 RepID=UPI002236173F|nr:hypothetical protein [Microbacterium sp. MPKO10]MCW4456907.1 hypothetical protein [Microbacterium sp. MPKO10]